EYTVRRYLRMTCSEEEIRQNLLQMCLSIPAIPYRQLIAHGLNARQLKPFLAAVA
ncbi:transposase, partial [Paenibacillus barengoltzii]